MIKTSGANVSPAEVEQVLLSIPSVETAVVVGVPDPQRDQIVGAALVPAPGADIDTELVLAETRRQLSSFKIPRRLQVYTDDEFPRLANGKPDKQTLIKLLSQPKTD
jgi:acyl-coenzyme A synthetase/AMP-(fatty) acid ligase